MAEAVNTTRARVNVKENKYNTRAHPVKNDFLEENTPSVMSGPLGSLSGYPSERDMERLLGIHVEVAPVGRHRAVGPKTKRTPNPIENRRRPHENGLPRDTGSRLQSMTTPQVVIPTYWMGADVP